MKLVLPIIFILNISNSFSDEICSVNADEKVSNFAKEGCQLAGSLTSCAQVKPDPDATKKFIAGLLNDSIDNQESIQRNWEAKYNKTVYAQLFDYQPSKAKSNKNYVPTHLVDWYKNGTADSADRNKLIQSITDGYVKHAKEFECEPVIKHRNVTHNYPDNFETQDEAELKKMMSAADYKTKRSTYFKELNSKRSKEMIFCDEDQVSTRPFTHDSVIHPPCSENVGSLLPDNEWDLSKIDSKGLNQMSEALSSCIQDRLSKGAKIHHISIASSSSALNNTNKAAEMFCPKGFLALSKARATSANETFVPKILSGTELKNVPVKSQFKGQNGDGTSGPCPYTIVNGVEVYKEKYKTESGKKSLDEYKYVKLHVTFEASTDRTNNSTTYYAAKHSCRNIYFECGTP
jgi:hypothetical protein